MANKLTNTNNQSCIWQTINQHGQRIDRHLTTHWQQIDKHEHLTIKFATIKEHFATDGQRIYKYKQLTRK